jgi:hypothetical protein
LSALSLGFVETCNARSPNGPQFVFVDFFDQGGALQLQQTRRLRHVA